MPDALGPVAKLAASLLAALCGACAMAPAVAPKPPACAAPEHRQFDFWLGEWEVRDPAGKLAGRNTIVAIQGGCALQENWSGVSGSAGTSLNAYDGDRKRWHQTWVDNGGGLLLLEGGLIDGRMVLTGESSTADSPPKLALQRITWTPLPDGRVRQLWEASTDGGRGWTIVFDGIYAKAR
jgi:hypothetical protein